MGKVKQHHYRLTYTEQYQLFPNFGKGNWEVPMTVYRHYEEDLFNNIKEMDDYVMKLSNPQATKIEKKVDGGEWSILYPKTEEVTNGQT